MKKIFTYITALFFALALVSCDKIFDSLDFNCDSKETGNRKAKKRKNHKGC